MITFDSIRSALSMPDPYAEMDRLVRAELNAGRKVREIFDDINPIVNETLTLDGLTPDAEEAFLGTLDALTGGCHSKSNYYDPEPIPHTTANGTPRIGSASLTPHP